MIKTFYPSTCKTCKSLYQPVTWLAWRVEGYCCEKCQPEKVVLAADECELF